MVGLGTLINVAAVVAGGIGGLLFGKLLTEKLQDALMKVLGISTMFLGIGGCMEKMLKASQDGALFSVGSMMMILSLVLGTVLGEILDIEGLLVRFGAWLRRKTGSEGEKGFIEGFVTTSLTICIGAMAIIGSIEDGISGNYSILLAKAVLDLVIVMIFAASLGKGCIFAAIPVAILQGSVTVLAKLIAPVMTEHALSNISYVGSILIFCVGLNLIREEKIRVANMLPAVLLAVLASYLPV